MPLASKTLEKKPEVIRSELNTLEKTLSKELVDNIVESFDGEIDERFSNYIKQLDNFGSDISSKITDIRSDVVNNSETLNISISERFTSIDSKFISCAGSLEEQIKLLQSTCQQEMEQIRISAKETSDRTAQILTDHVTDTEKILEQDRIQLETRIKLCNNSLNTFTQLINDMQKNGLFEPQENIQKQLDTMSGRLDGYEELLKKSVSELSELMIVQTKPVTELAKVSEQFPQKTFKAAVVSSVLSVITIVVLLISFFI